MSLPCACREGRWATSEVEEAAGPGQVHPVEEPVVEVPERRALDVGVPAGAPTLERAAVEEPIEQRNAHWL
jgi:hypothetical protein